MRFDRKQLLIYAVTDKVWTGKLSLEEQVEEALKGGATMVQLREKELDKGNFEEVLRTGVTAKTVDQARAAQAAGADYLGSGAIFGTSTKADARQ